MASTSTSTSTSAIAAGAAAAAGLAGAVYCSCALGSSAAEEKSEVIELIMGMAKERGESAATSSAAYGPHYGKAAANTGAGGELASLFGDKWCMLSYTWDHQEEVKSAHDMLKARGIPTWMDVDGGMQTDIYDSMAEGVGNAAVVIPFMGYKYQVSENCKLELKFAKQTGVPIVPVMMEAGFRPSGWLGLLTAGSLWTPLHDKATLEENVDGLVRQIKLAIAPDADEPVDSAQEDFSAKELRDELDRLAQEDGEEQPTEEARIPALAPPLPAGVLITPEMETLLSKLVDPSRTRVGFCGMGGIGKTVISSWLVRHNRVRQTFEKIAWVTLGQTPNIDTLQRVLYEQLVAPCGGWDENAAPDVKTQRMGEAFRGQKVLLVLDDLWETEHEKALNFIDEATPSKVLVSSRVRSSLVGSTSRAKDLSGEESTTIVQIALPSEEQAVQMLLSTAGMTADTSAPKEALELVKFCKMLPLAISIAGQLVKDLELEAAKDWDGVVAMMKEEFADGSRQSVEETVILTSLKSVSGSHKDNVTSLFKCLAIVPEDTIVPLDILGLMFQAGCSTDEKPASRPRIMMIRRWLKVLIERSLVLGTVDRISLHDIVRDFTVSMYTKEELRQAHRRLINLLRENRPQAPTLVPEWSRAGEMGQPDKAVAYVQDASIKHIEEAIDLADWESDELVTNGWLGDHPHDMITHATANVLGMERLDKLVTAAEDSGDQWTLARRSVLAGHLAKRGGDVSAPHELFRRGVDALGKLAAGEATAEERQAQEALELHTLALGLFVANNPADAKYLPRMQHLVQQEHLDRMPTTKAMCYAFISTVTSLTVDLSQHAELFPMFLKTVSAGARTHLDQRMRWLCKFFLVVGGHMQPCFTNDDWDWDEFLDTDGTNMMQQATEFYTFETCHSFLIREDGCWGMDCFLNLPIASNCMAYHYGLLVEGVKHYEDTAMPAMDLILAQPNQELECTTTLTYILWWPFVLDLKRPTPFRLALEKAKMTWSEADATYDKWLPNFAWPTRPRGETTEGFAFTVEHFSWMAKLAHALVGGADEVATDEIVASLPSWEDHLEIVKASLPFANAYVLYGELASLSCMVALLYEKLGRVDEALEWAERVATLDDPAKGGNMALVARMRGLRLQGRCLAAKGQKAEAEAVLTSAAEQLASIEYYLAEVLALRDLFVCVLKATDREGEGLVRLKAAIVRLVGADAAPEQLDVLATSLGDEVDLAAVLKHE